MPSHPPHPTTVAETGPVRLIVLAGQRCPSSDPLSERFGVSHRSLIPLAGRPLIAHVLQTGAQHPKIGSLAICIEQEAFDPVWDVLTRLPGRGAVTLVEAREDVAQSIRAAAQGWDGPLLVTTADHALLSGETIDQLVTALESADIALALAPREAVEAVHPSGSPHYLTLRDGHLAPCDLYGVRSADFLGAATIFRGRRASVRVALRIARAMGLLGLLLLALGLETRSGALARASRRLKARVEAVITPDGTQAIDVGNEQSYAIVRHQLEARAREVATVQDTALSAS
ncbi:NTP transferase domain-containing protein [Novosphingobium mangrovi (ex Hu et al. 2023)]|uniref:Nucleotidyltransferase family protein n=1 Tax=Novosphingobium mangrovi (ex Hu et al. 2023) TaxID=2930094 RepID=A0ABT0AFT5_9SPHN|nr:NTP transferase domain-containing protein [Novosphingobium mangrovi (ex Hu et al. 2023)]MCJ1962062.1 nucleotidyltransferase family protein [Novosphingobium mangrovi (ex Hu et al. 2023)]